MSRDVLGWAYLGNRKFTRGCLNLIYRGEKLPVHVDVLASVSHLVANLTLLDTEMNDIVIPDTLEHNGLDLFLTHIVYRDWHAAVPLQGMTFLDAILCTGVMAFFDAPDHAFGDIDAKIGHRLQKVVFDSLGVEPNDLNDPHWIDNSHIRCYPTCCSEINCSSIRRSDIVCSVGTPLYGCVGLPHCKKCTFSSCVACVRYAVPKPGTRDWDALVKNRPFVESYMPTTWNLIRHARSLVPSHNDGARDGGFPQLVARYPEAIERLTSYCTATKNGRRLRFLSKTSALAELRRRLRLGRPVVAGCVPYDAYRQYDARAFQAILERDNLVMLAKCCSGGTLDELEALFREIKVHVFAVHPLTLGVHAVPGGQGEAPPNTLGINLDGSVFTETGHECFRDRTYVAARVNIVRTVITTTHWYARNVVGIPAFPDFPEAEQNPPPATQNMYFVVPETVGLERVMSWRTRFLAIFCALTPPLEEFAV